MPLTNTPETLNILDPDSGCPNTAAVTAGQSVHGDSLQILHQFEPSSFDAIITDPPYASGGSGQTTKTAAPAKSTAV